MSQNSTDDKTCTIKGNSKKNFQGNRKHTKYSKDNILRKIKVKFINFIIDCLNAAIYYVYGTQRFKFRKLSGEFSKNIKISFNSKFVNKPIKELFKQEISKKYDNNKKSLNKKYIKRVEKNTKDKLILSFLDKNFDECYEECFMKGSNILQNEYNEILEKAKNFEECFKKEKDTERDYYNEIKRISGQFIAFFKGEYHLDN